MRSFLTLLAWALIGFVGPCLALAQTLTPAQRQALDEGIGDRVGAMTVLASDQAASGGLYSWRASEERADILKLTWYVEFDEDKPLPLADTGLHWSPVLEGALGFVEVNSELPETFLAGNTSVTKSYVLGAGGGARLFFTEDLSVLPAFTLIYSHTRERFESKNAAGDLVQASNAGDDVNWDVNQITYNPQAEIRFRHRWGDVRLTLTTGYYYYQGEPVGSAPDVSAFKSESGVWLNKADLEAWTGLFIGRYQIRTGGYFQRQDLFGGLPNVFLTDYVYTAGIRAVLDVKDHFWMFEYLGLGASYFWSNIFSGWSWGFEVSVYF